MDNSVWINNTQTVQPRFRNEEDYAYHSPIDNGKRLLFAGCSITANVGLETSPDGGWSDELIKILRDSIEISCSNNCSISGASTFEIISNVFRFISVYGKPDMIFMLLPPVQRESNAYAKTLEACKAIDYNMFSILDQYCNQNGIELIASTWDFYIEGVTSWFVDDNNKDETYKLLKDFDSFFFVDKDKFSQDVFEASGYGETSLEGEDRHPSLPVHIGYTQMFSEEYKRRKCLSI